MVRKQASLTCSRGVLFAYRGSFRTEKSSGKRISHIFRCPSDFTCGCMVGKARIASPGPSSLSRPSSSLPRSSSPSMLFGSLAGIDWGVPGTGSGCWLATSGSGTLGTLGGPSMSASDSQSLAIHPPLRMVSLRTWSADSGTPSAVLIAVSWTLEMQKS